MADSTVYWMVEWWAVVMDGKMVGMMAFLSAVWMALWSESSKVDLKADEMVRWMADSTVCWMVEWWVDQSGPKKAEQKVERTAVEKAALSVEWMVGCSVAWWAAQRAETKDGWTVVDWVVRKVG